MSNINVCAEYSHYTVSQLMSLSYLSIGGIIIIIIIYDFYIYIIIIYFNENQIEFSSTPIPNSTLDLEIKYKKFLNKKSRDNINSQIAHKFRLFYCFSNNE